MNRAKIQYTFSEDSLGKIYNYFVFDEFVFL